METEASAVNQPHVDDTTDPEEFFGDFPDPEPLSEPSSGPPAYDPDPGELGQPTEPVQAASAPEVQPEAASDADAEAEKARGQIEREYIVFHQLALNEQTLRRLLREIDEGVAQVKVAYVEIHRSTQRNDKGAVGEAYAAHAKQLGATCDLAAVSSRSFKQRHIRPEVPVERRFKIT